MRGYLLTIAALSTLAGCSAETEVVGLYDRTGVPAVPDRTASIDARPGTAIDPTALADGDYWAVTVTVTDGGLAFRIAQALLGPTCLAELGEAACVGGIGLVGASTVDLVVDRDATAAIGSLTVVADDRRNYAVSPDELLRLAAGSPPSAAAPPSYSWTDSPFLVAVRNGRVVSVRQIWAD